MCASRLHTLSSSLEVVSPHLLHFTEAPNETNFFFQMFHICNFPFSTVDDETILLLMIYINPFNFELLVLPTTQSTLHINIIASNVIRGRKKLREEYDIKHV